MCILRDLSWRSYFTFVTFRYLFSHLTVIIVENLLSSFFSFTFKPKIMQKIYFFTVNSFVTTPKRPVCPSAQAICPHLRYSVKPLQGRLIQGTNKPGWYKITTPHLWNLLSLFSTLVKHKENLQNYRIELLW